jgi:hypothetical protein
MNELAWIKEYGSGTLQRAVELGAKYHSMYLHERVAFYFGAGFEAVQSSRITTGKPIAVWDCSAFTETCWFVRRLRAIRSFDAELIYITITDDNNKTRKGLGIKINNPNPEWLNSCYEVVALVAEEVNGEYKDAVNPC